MGTQSKRFTNASAEIKSALKAFHHATSKGLLTHWLLTQRELNAPTHTIPSIEAQRQATNRVLSQGLKLVAQQDEKYAETLRLRFIRGENATQTAILLNTSIPSIYRWQRTALDALTALLLRNEDTLHHAEIQRLRQSLPAPTCEQLVGGIEIRKKVVAHLLKKEAPWLFLMTGIGGIGKTTQINAVVRDVIPSLHFQHILWVTITHQNFGMEHNRASDCYEQVIKVIAKYLDDDTITLSNHDEIKRWMQTERTLLVVDNIEAAEDAVYLWHQLRNWVNPSKIIFTSRASPPNLHQLYTQSLEELSQSDTLTLIRQES
ncbi:MAG: hypothetical protein KAG66_18380, partial [Methylococcales bacterium]|nr:hypothetical protein [Methylococcales bacterium]